MYVLLAYIVYIIALFGVYFENIFFLTHLEPDILECEGKWDLESITTNKASGGAGIPVDLFQILKDDAVKVLFSVCQQIQKYSASQFMG